jgi:hypothetical protein
MLSPRRPKPPARGSAFRFQILSTDPPIESGAEFSIPRFKFLQAVVTAPLPFGSLPRWQKSSRTEKGAAHQTAPNFRRERAVENRNHKFLTAESLFDMWICGTPLLNPAKARIGTVF